MIDHGTVSCHYAASQLEVNLDTIFIVYDYYQENLKELWKNRRFYQIVDIVEIGVQLMKAIQNIHEAGYVHGDIKLDNIMVDANKRVFLIDYGCAQSFYLEDGSHRPNV